MKKRAAILIDGPNAKASANAAGFQIDYMKLRSHYEQEFDLFRAVYFTALPPRSVEAPIHKLADWLSMDGGYNLVSKEMKEYAQVDGTTKTKGNMDVEICIHAMELSRAVDELVFFTGDGDFRFLVETIQRSNVRVTVVAHKDLCSFDLRKQADKFIDLTTMRSMFTQTRSRYSLEG